MVLGGELRHYVVPLRTQDPSPVAWIQLAVPWSGNAKQIGFSTVSQISNDTGVHKYANAGGER